MRGWARPAPCPLPPAPLAELWGGGGRVGGPGLAWGFWAGKGGSLASKPRVEMASKFGGLFSRVNPAGFHGKIFWRVILAHLFGGSFWRIYLAGFHSQWNMQTLKQRKRKEKKCTINRSVSCIMSLYIASNIMSFCSRCRFYWTS